MPESADFRPERADSRPENAYFRSERVDFRPERAWRRTHERTHERTNESPPVFYRTLSPSGPLPKNEMIVVLSFQIVGHKSFYDYLQNYHQSFH